jgi:hypothetical protein
VAISSVQVSSGEKEPHTPKPVIASQHQPRAPALCTTLEKTSKEPSSIPTPPN